MSKLVLTISGLWCIFFLSVSVFSQHIVKDINTLPASLVDVPNNSSQRCFTCGSLVYFDAKDSLGNELWRTDGTGTGTKRVTDLAPGQADGIYPYESIFCFNGLAYFRNKTSGNLWKTDGTAAGTVSVTNHPVSPYGISIFNNKIYFFSSDNQMWTTDGVTGTDKLIKTIDYGNVNGRYVIPPNGFAAGSSTMYFMIAVINNSGPERFELWKTDGTTSGTVIIKSWPYFNGYPSKLTTLGEKLLFSVTDEDHGSELWSSDGTEAGTQIVLDINPGPAGNPFFVRTVFNNQIVFHNNKDTWISDGTSLGTKIIMPKVLSYSSCIWENTLYIVGPETNSFNTILFKTSGTLESSIKLDTIGSFFHYPDKLPIINNKILFPFFSETAGVEVGASDGSLNNAKLVKDINPGLGDSSPRSFVTLNNQAIFLADDGQKGFELWATDATSSGTKLVMDVKSGTESANITKIYSLNGKLHFLAGPNNNERSLWTSDGTLTGTALTKGFSQPHIFGQTNNYLVILDNRKFWKSNGTIDGTTVMWDFAGIHNSHGYNSNPGIAAGENLFFEFTASGVTDLWRANTTTNEVIKVASADPNLLLSFYPFKGAGIGNELVIAASDPTHGKELWITTNNGTQKKILIDIVSGVNGSSPDAFVSVGNKVFFTATDPLHGYELWITDGTEVGTKLVKDIITGTSQGFAFSNGSAPLGSKLIFTSFKQNGQELWISDGTEIGTFALKPIELGLSSPSNYVTIGDKVYFAATDNVGGRELFVTDGTQAGTKLIDVVPGAIGSNPTGIVKAKNAIYFYSNKKIWRTLGTTSSSEIVASIDILSDLVPVGDAVCFVAQHPLFGSELFAVDVTKFNQTISLSPIGAKTFGNPPFHVTAVASSGLNVTITTVKDNLLISGNQVQLVKPGSATVNINQAGDENYNAATPVSETFCVKPPTPTITLDRQNNSTLLISSSVSNNKWYKNGVLLNSTDQKLPITEDGAYSLVVSIDNCDSETSTLGQVIVSAKENQKDVEIYPVPSSDFINVRLPSNASEAKFVLCDIHGRSIEQRTSQGGVEQFDLRELPTGVYLLNIQTVNKGTVRLFIKQ